MFYYPMFVKLKNKKCTVIGGGMVAERKVSLLIEAEALVEVISPFLTDRLKQFSEDGKINYLKRNYKNGDGASSFLVIAATDNHDVNREIYENCSKLDILVNVIDAPELCDFIVPSSIIRGPVTITVSTDGKSPALAKKIKKEIEQVYGDEYGKLAALMGNLRPRIQNSINDEVKRMKFWENLLNSNILSLLKNGKESEIEELIETCLSCF